MTFGERLKALRQEHDLTLRDLGKRLGFNQGYLSKVEHGLTPSDRLVNSLAQEFKAPEFYHLAGKAIPTEFSVAERYNYVKENWGNDPNEVYPESDPYLRYGQDFPDILKLNNLQEKAYLFDIGFNPADIEVYPPIRRRLIEIEIEQNQNPTSGEDFGMSDVINKLKNEQDNVRFRQIALAYLDFYHLSGQTIGLREALNIMKRTQQEKGDYALLAAFYEPEMAQALADIIKIMRRLTNATEKTEKKDIPS